jgi:tetratricopeptide (TPR) repeat protein
LDILNYSSFLDPDFMPIDIFTKLLTIDEDYLNETVNFLKQLSLITIERKNDDMGIKIHRTLQNETKEYLKKRDLSKLSKFTNQYCNLMKETFNQVNYQWKKEKYYSNFKQIIEICISNGVIENFSKYKLSMYFGDYIYNLKINLNEALQYYNKSLEIIQKIPDYNYDLGITNLLDKIGIVNKHFGKYNEALDYYNQSLNIRKTLFKTDENEHMASNLNNFVFIYCKK